MRSTRRLSMVSTEHAAKTFQQRLPVWRCRSTGSSLLRGHPLRRSPPEGDSNVPRESRSPYHLRPIDQETTPRGDTRHPFVATGNTGCGTRRIGAVPPEPFPVMGCITRIPRGQHIASCTPTDQAIAHPHALPDPLHPPVQRSRSSPATQGQPTCELFHVEHRGCSSPQQPRDVPANQAHQRQSHRFTWNITPSNPAPPPEISHPTPRCKSREASAPPDVPRETRPTQSRNAQKVEPTQNSQKPQQALPCREAAPDRSRIWIEILSTQPPPPQWDLPRGLLNLQRTPRHDVARHLDGPQSLESAD